MANLFIDGTKLMYHPDVLAKWLANEEFFPVHAEVSTTSACNHRCILCCVDYLGHKAQHLPREILLDLVRSFARCGVRSFLLAGEGEPLLNQHVAEMIGLAHALGVDAAVNTNGVCMTPELAKDILDKILWIRFSLQAADPELYGRLHGTSPEDLEKVKENIAACTELKRKLQLPVRIGIQQILLPENVDQVLPLARLAKSLGVDYYTVKRHSTHPQNPYSVPENIHEFVGNQFDEAKRLETDSFKALIRYNDFADKCVRTYRQCLGLPFIVQVLADGGLYTCCQHFRMDRFCYGNLYEKSFEDIWKSDRRRQVIQDVIDNVDVSRCMTYCRHHNVNKYLWQLRHPPEHVNFI